MCIEVNAQESHSESLLVSREQPDSIAFASFFNALGAITAVIAAVETAGTTEAAVVCAVTTTNGEADQWQKQRKNKTRKNGFYQEKLLT